MKTLLIGAMLLALTMPLSGCIPMLAGYLIAKAVEGPSVVTTNCVKGDHGQQTCTTTTKP